MKILIGSVYSSFDEKNIKWRNLQNQFLEKSTDQFDHISIIASNKPEDISENPMAHQMPNSILTSYTGDIPTTGKNIKGSHRHMAGLICLLDKMKEMAEVYDRFLILDSDAFPVYKSWMNRLEQMMGKRTIAMARRFEVLDVRPHLSIGYMNKKELTDLRIGIIQKTNLLGETWGDVNIIHNSPEESILPLGRTNRVNLHYLLYGIYGDIFYHHGAATNAELRYKRNIRITAKHRNKELRNRKRNNFGLTSCSSYYRHTELGKWDTFHGHVIRTEQFWEDPSKFIIDMGWGHDKYVDLNHD